MWQIILQSALIDMIDRFESSLGIGSHGKQMELQLVMSKIITELTSLGQQLEEQNQQIRNMLSYYQYRSSANVSQSTNNLHYQFAHRQLFHSHSSQPSINDNLLTAKYPSIKNRTKKKIRQSKTTIKNNTSKTLSQKRLYSSLQKTKTSNSMISPKNMNSPKFMNRQKKINNQSQKKLNLRIPIKIGQKLKLGKSKSQKRSENIELNRPEYIYTLNSTVKVAVKRRQNKLKL